MSEDQSRIRRRSSLAEVITAVRRLLRQDDDTDGAASTEVSESGPIDIPGVGTVGTLTPTTYATPAGVESPNRDFYLTIADPSQTTGVRE